MLDDDRTAAAQPRFEDEAYDDDEQPQASSLTEDIAALIEDGRTYAEAEMAYQKTRISFSAEKGRKGALFGVFALFLLHLALIALVVGLLIALSPVLTPLGATALVTGVLVVVALLLALQARKHFAAISDAFKEGRE